MRVCLCVWHVFPSSSHHQRKRSDQRKRVEWRHCHVPMLGSAEWILLQWTAARGDKNEKARIENSFSKVQVEGYGKLERTLKAHFSCLQASDPANPWRWWGSCWYMTMWMMVTVMVIYMMVQEDRNNWMYKKSTDAYNLLEIMWSNIYTAGVLA